MGNSFDKRYDIRLATKDDIEGIMNFLGNNWKANHIMAHNRELFEYEFLEEDGTVNFILAIDRIKGTIECINGFLKASHDSNKLDIWSSFLKVLDGNMSMLGIELIKRRKELINCRCDLGVGDNPNTYIPIVKKIFKHHVAKMKHYYSLAARKNYKIARINYIPTKRIGDKTYKVVKFSNAADLKARFDTSKLKQYIPYKDNWYIQHRFFEHPIYKYEVYGIENDKCVEAVFVLRKQPYQGRVAVRFVDYIGKHYLFAGIGRFLDDYLNQSEEYEYIDFYCSGIKEEYILDAGFVVRKDDDENIIPNYFGPFIQENIDIWVDSREAGSVFTKADGDQDRPNII